MLFFFATFPHIKYSFFDIQQLYECLSLKMEPCLLKGSIKQSDTQSNNKSMVLFRSGEETAVYDGVFFWVCEHVKCVFSWFPITDRESECTPVCLRPNAEVGRERDPIYSDSSWAGTWDDEGPSSASSEAPCCSSVTSATTFRGHFLGRPRGRLCPTGSTFFSAVLGPLLLLPFGRPLGLFGVGGPTGSCCCFRGRPLPLRWGSSGDWAVLDWGDGSLVPLSLMPASVHLL